MSRKPYFCPFLALYHLKCVEIGQNGLQIDTNHLFDYELLITNYLFTFAARFPFNGKTN